MQINYPKRGEVYNLPFSQSHGSEMQDKHPAVVVQNDKANRFSSLIIVVPVTGTLKVADLPIGVKIMPPGRRVYQTFSGSLRTNLYGKQI